MDLILSLPSPTPWITIQPLADDLLPTDNISQIRSTAFPSFQRRHFFPVVRELSICRSTTDLARCRCSLTTKHHKPETSIPQLTDQPFFLHFIRVYRKQFIGKRRFILNLNLFYLLKVVLPFSLGKFQNKEPFLYQTCRVKNSTLNLGLSLRSSKSTSCR